MEQQKGDGPKGNLRLINKKNEIATAVTRDNYIDIRSYIQRMYIITINVPRDIIFFCGTITL
jgi:hypothetical protein